VTNGFGDDKHLCRETQEIRGYLMTMCRQILSATFGGIFLFVHDSFIIIRAGDLG
jgi:hypothetical protein